MVGVQSLLKERYLNGKTVCSPTPQKILLLFLFFLLRILGIYKIRKDVLASLFMPFGFINAWDNLFDARWLFLYPTLWTNFLRRQYRLIFIVAIAYNSDSLGAYIVFFSWILYISTKLTKKYKIHLEFYIFKVKLSMQSKKEHGGLFPNTIIQSWGRIYFSMVV